MTIIIDIFGLVAALATLAYAVAKYWFFAGTWEEVQAAQDIVWAWFAALDKAIVDYGGYILTLALYQVSQIYGASLGVIDDLVTKMQGLWLWFTLMLPAMWAWYQNVYAKVALLAGEYWDVLLAIIVGGVEFVETLLGGYLDAILAFFADPLTFIDQWLGGYLSAIISFFASPLSSLRDWLSWLIDPIQAFLDDPWGFITDILGPAWVWLLNFVNAPLQIITAALGPAWTFLVSLFTVSGPALFAFIRDAMLFWYNVFVVFGPQLVSFLASPIEYIFAALRDGFLGWLEQLIAENW